MNVKVATRFEAAENVANYQPYWSLLLFVAVLAASLYFSYSGHSLLAVSLLIGLGLGFAFQRSRFCITSAFRDFILFRNVEMTLTIVYLLALLTAGFVIINVYSHLKGLSLPVAINTFGVHTALGSMMFGTGMVIAGGCATGMMTRLGEGHIQHMCTFAGFLTGSVLGAWHRFYWIGVIQASPKMFLPDRFGWPGAASLQFLVLAILYKFFTRYRFVPKDNPQSKLNHRKNLLRESWSYRAGATVIAILGTLLYLYRGRAFSVTTGITYWGSWLYTKLGGQVSEWVYYQSPRHEAALHNGFLLTTESFLNAGFILGALISMLAASEGRLRKVRSWKHAGLAAAGGLLMGYGSRLSQGCNIGAFLSAVSSLSVQGWVYAVFVFFGAYLGTRIMLWAFLDS